MYRHTHIHRYIIYILYTYYIYIYREGGERVQVVILRSTPCWSQIVPNNQPALPVKNHCSVCVRLSLLCTFVCLVCVRVCVCKCVCVCVAPAPWLAARTLI